MLNNFQTPLQIKSRLHIFTYMYHLRVKLHLRVFFDLVSPTVKWALNNCNIFSVLFLNLVEVDMINKPTMMYHRNTCDL